MGVGDVSKRILLGRKLRSSQLGETLLPKRIALPVFASDALSSVAYAPDDPDPQPTAPVARTTDTVAACTS